MSSARRTTTRPKKLQSRQHIQIVREDQIENVIDIDSGRAPIETGVEKAEEAVSFTPSPSPANFTRVLALTCCHQTHRQHPRRHQISSILTFANRNIICSKPSKLRKPIRKMQNCEMHTSLLHLPLPVIFNMMFSIPKAGNNQQHTSDPQPQSKSVQERRIAWMRRMSWH